MSVRIAAIDGGNDGVKAIMGEEKTEWYIPNAIAELPEKREVVQLEKDILDGIHVEIVSPSLAEGKGIYAVGSLATKYKDNDELTTDIPKYENDQTLILILTTTAIDAVKHLRKKDQMKVQAKYHLSTGLPLAEVKQGKKEIFYNRLVDTTHTVRFLDTPLIGGVTVEIRYETVLVNTEGLAALADLAFDENGSIKNEELLKMDVIIDDIGGLSTDVAVIRKDGSIDNVHSDGMKDGVSPYLDDIIKEIAKKYDFDLKSRNDLVEIITAKDTETKNHIWKRGVRTSIKDIVDKHLKSLAKEEFRLLKSIWDDVPNTRRAYMIGGGSLVLRPYLEELNRKEQYPIYFFDEKESIWMIANAYYKALKFFLAENANKE